MEQKNLPCITEDILQQYADEQSFQRGMQYHYDEAISEPLREGFLLQGLCDGTRHEPYRVRVLLGEEGIREASCTCPRGGFCKHIVALLLTYIHEPGAFYDVVSWQKKLADFSKEDLIKLIEDMVQHDLSLLSLVERRVSLSNQAETDASFLRRDVGRVLSMSHLDDIERSLWDLLQIAEEKEDDWLGAGRVYKEVLAGLASVYEELLEMDHDGDLCVVAGDCVEGLGECLQSCDDDAVRLEWLVTLLEAEVADIVMGGIEFSGDALDIIFDHASAEDWSLLEKRVLELIPGSDEWMRERLVGILLGGLEKTGRDAEASKLIEEMGTERQIMFLRAREGKPQKAVALAKKHFTKSPGIIIDLANVLVEDGAAEHGVALLTELVQSKNSYSWYLQWVANYYAQEGNLEETLRWQKELFLSSPGIKAYENLQSISEKLGIWEKLRIEVLKELEEKGQWSSLLEIALHEGKVERALELLPLVRGGLGYYRAMVAKAAEDKLPLDAITLYRKMAEEAISGRQRKTYQQAALHLERIKALYGGLQDRAKWEECIAGFRRDYAHLPALQDELRNAGL